MGPRLHMFPKKKNKEKTTFELTVAPKQSRPLKGCQLGFHVILRHKSRGAYMTRKDVTKSKKLGLDLRQQ